MRRVPLATACLALLALPVVPAGASPIQLRMLGSAYIAQDYDDVREIPDDFRGGVLSLGETRIARTYESEPDPVYGEFAYAEQTIPIKNPFFLELDFVHPGETSGIRGASVYLDGELEGSIFGPRNESHLSGGFRGVVTSAEVRIWDPRDGGSGPLSVEGPDADPGIPRELLDLFADPERLHITGIVTGGRLNTLEVSLAVTPPPVPGTPVPEPAALGSLLVGAAGVARRRARARRTGGAIAPSR